MTSTSQMQQHADEPPPAAPPGVDPLQPTMAGSTYTDAGYFAREQEELFEREWMCAARTADLERPGQFEKVQIGRESVLVVRGRDKKLRAFLNICRHRGAMLCTEDSGEVRRNLQCPYHAWTYGLDGKLVAAPNMASIDIDGSLDRTAYGLVPVALTEWLGYAWVCLADEPPSFEEQVMGTINERFGEPDVVDRYDVPSLGLGRRIRYDVKANWKLIVENFMECYHCATIHPELTEVLPEFTSGIAAQVGVGHGALFGEDIEGFTVDGKGGFAPLPGLTDEEDRRYFAATVAPTIFLNLVPDHVIVHRMFPMAADRTVVICDWLFAPEVAADSAGVESSVELFHRVNWQDFDACERTQPAMSSRAYRAGGVLVPAEHHIGEFHEWVRSRVGSS
ncbi:aromatic ring-hydroxylating oxygenase subunit alpha [Dermacoccaceae bacterium W4C1]